jgi:hypothetical protein
MTVPPEFRRNGEVPAILRLHKARLTANEIILECGYAVTTPIRAIMDLATSGEADRDLVAQATNEGQKRGLITRNEAAVAHARRDIPSWLRLLLETRR